MPPTATLRMLRAITGLTSSGISQAPCLGRAAQARCLPCQKTASSVVQPNSLRCSRPSKARLGTYWFFLDGAGHVAEAAMGEALAALHRRCTELRFLGDAPGNLHDGSSRIGQRRPQAPAADVLAVARDVGTRRTQDQIVAHAASQDALRRRAPQGVVTRSCVHS